MSESQQVSNLAAWLEATRGPDGYGGPVVHWWQSCLSYTGAGLDWRYEGIIGGYLMLWTRTGEATWLARARRAGDDLVRGQLPSGNFRHSSFEQNPYTGGTPHEAAADLGLLQLAAALRAAGDQDWEDYARAAEANIRHYHLNRLWDAGLQTFRNDPHNPPYVPNKVCTLAETLFAWAELRGEVEPIERYALPALYTVVALQVKSSGPLVGAFPQSAIKDEAVEDYFPYYNARCIPALLLAYKYTGDEAWVTAALAIGYFIMKQIDADGLLPQVLYRSGINRYPQWIAPLGDVLRTLDMLRPHGFNLDTSKLEGALCAGFLASGGVATARGFAGQIGQRFDSTALPDFRDNLPVVGWVDKVFNWLAGRVTLGQSLPSPEVSEVILDCSVRGRPAQWRETTEEMTLTVGVRTLYHWHKGQPWAEIVAPEVMWK